MPRPVFTPDHLSTRRQATASCTKCGASLAADAVYCSSCGAPAGAGNPEGTGSPQAGGKSHLELPGIAYNVAGLLCYILWPVASAFFLLVSPYNRNRFVRFHAFQALFLWLGWILVAVALQIMTSILALVPLLGWLVGGLLWIVFVLTVLIVVILMMYKSYNGEWTSMPVVGNLARQQSEKMA